MPRKRRVSKNYKELPFVTNIEQQTLQNTDYRRVLYTDGNLQLVLMSVPVGEEVGMEIHPHTTQFIRVESGQARVVLKGTPPSSHGNKRRSSRGRSVLDLEPGDVVVVPFNTYHNVINASPTEPLQLYTIYAPAEHAPREVQVTKAIKKTN